MCVNVALTSMIRQKGSVIPAEHRHHERQVGAKTEGARQTQAQTLVSERGALPGFMTRAGRGEQKWGGRGHGSEALTPSDNNALFPL